MKLFLAYLRSFPWILISLAPICIFIGGLQFGMTHQQRLSTREQELLALGIFIVPAAIFTFVNVYIAGPRINKIFGE
jgi:hypothetical protein